MTKTKKKNFEFTKDNLTKAKTIISHYPEGRQKSALLPLLDLAQRQNDNFLSSDAIEYVSQMLDLPFIHSMQVASFYTMFNLKPVGKHFIQLCGTTPCWLRGSGDIKKACEEKLKIKEGETTSDGLFTLKEVECLGACVNAPVVQINDDYYEDLNPEIMKQVIQDLIDERKIKYGSQIGRVGSAPRDYAK